MRSTTCDELVLTELVFENVLEPLSCEEAVALLSAFVFQQRTDDASELNERLREAQKIDWDCSELGSSTDGPWVGGKFPPAFSFMRGLFEVELTD